MRIEIKTHQIERIANLSRYNFNLYKLPITVDGCDVVLDERGVSEDFGNYAIGRVEYYKFVPVYYLNVEEIFFSLNETLVIDSEIMTTENTWT